MNWRACCCVFLLTGAPWAVALADASPLEALSWLARMGRAMQTSNYAGNFVYLHNGRVESLKVTHFADKQGEYERLVQLDGNAREVIRNNDLVTCIFPDDGVVIVERRRGSSYLPAALQTGHISSLVAYYRFTLGGEERVAGQIARVIEVQPLDSYRYGYRFWINVKNGLLLRSDLLDERGALAEQILFTDMQEVAPVPRSQVRPSVDTRNFTWYRHDQLHSQPASGASQWALKGLPEGFSLAEYHARMMLPNKNAPVKHLVVSDGLAAISVYIQRVDEGSRKRIGSYRVGGLNVHTAVSGSYQITALGDAPLATVRRVAEVTRFTGGDDD